MPTAIQVIPNRFDAYQAELSKKLGQPAIAPHIRRPTRGLVLKEETFATLRVVTQSSNAPIHLIDSGSNRKISDGDFKTVNGKKMRMTDVYSNFLLQSVQEDRVEKQQIVETFGEPFIFLFGERARVMNFSGVLLNSFDFNWEAEWWENYENFLRGTRCVENDAKVYLAFDETLINGYILNTQSQKASQERNYVQFSFSLFVTGYTNFSNIGDPKALQGSTQPIGYDQTGTVARSQFGPVLLTPNEEIAKAVIKDGKLDTNGISLAEGMLSQGIQAVDRAISLAQSSVNSALQTAGNIVTGAGTVVRVPYGFAGAIAFDPDIYIPTTKPGVARYTVFSDNSDEYVGESSQYGSSFRQVAFEDPSELEASDKELMGKAKNIWKEHGFNVEDSDIAKILGHVRGGVTVGLQIAHAVKSFSSAGLLPPAPALSISAGRAGGLPDIEG